MGDLPVRQPPSSRERPTPSIGPEIQRPLYWRANTQAKSAFPAFLARQSPMTLDEYLASEAGRFEDELCELLRIPSVSADSKYKGDVRQAGQWVASQLSGLGFQTQIFDTPGHPIVFAQSPEIPEAPTALVYGHYDVQPPDPLDEWITPPFEPTKRNGNLYARGATDDKGQMFTHIKSAEAWVRTAGKLPL